MCFLNPSADANNETTVENTIWKPNEQGAAPRPESGTSPKPEDTYKPPEGTVKPPKPENMPGSPQALGNASMQALGAVAPGLRMGPQVGGVVPAGNFVPKPKPKPRPEDELRPGWEYTQT